EECILQTKNLRSERSVQAGNHIRAVEKLCGKGKLAIKMSMVSFKLFKLNQAPAADMGIYLHCLTEQMNELLKPFYTVLFHVIVFGLIGGVVFATNNLLDFVLETSVIAGIQCDGMFLTIGLKMKIVKVLRLKLQQIVDEDIANEVAIYWDTEQKLLMQSL
ncbi:uncharacterized protein LOC129572676, partial [Sitodiplosis mosellana]|uniref:uncharacterized protein LOC129572676 n=1 Tax=Sitodiplosis mosellana TaxID=263140 RepID=UPI0024441A63